MYEELVKRLRLISKSRGGFIDLYGEAADAIEELSRENESLANSVNEASEILRNRKPKWISVEERLPETTYEAVWVLTARYEGLVWPAYHWNGGWADECGSVGDVTHWMPLPEPPKEET